MTKYPSELDTDVELPRVDDAVTEIGGVAIDGLRAATMAVQRAIGANPQGSTASLANRLSVALNDDGTLKSAALIAAGLIALPITNAMIGASAGIVESKLDLDVATQVLQDQIGSNDVDILALQESFSSIINDFNQHVAGTTFQHSSFDILLGAVLTGISATTVGGTLTEINNDLITHTSTATLGAHQAGNIATSGVYGGQSVTTVQGALDALDDATESAVVVHRDDHHANGILNWANYPERYNENHQIVPTTLGASTTALILSGNRNIIDFISLNLGSLEVEQGNVLVISDTLSAGQYLIDDVGPRNPVGSKPALTSTQLEIAGIFPSDGYVTAQIFSQSSLQQFKTTLAPTIHQSDIRVDSVQMARPNAARVLSLGFNPAFVTASSTLALTAGVGTALTRSITVGNLHLDRNGAAASPVTINSVIERINSVFQNRVDGNAFPVAAYRVGDELMLCHNWNDDSSYYLSVLSSGTGNFELGFDGYGANILDETIRPTQNGKFFVGGNSLNDFAQIIDTTASISGQIFTLTGVNPLQEGVKVGHLLHLKSHPTDTNAIGTYFIISVNSTSVTVHKNAGVTAASGVAVEIWHDAAPLEDFNAAGVNNLVNIFVDHLGRTTYNQRLECSENISNLAVVDVSDNFLAGTHTLGSSISGNAVTLRLTTDGVSGQSVVLPTTISGSFKVYGQSNIEWVTVKIDAPISADSNTLTTFDQIDEEELLEICTVRLDGATVASDIVDKRLFGSVGLDEVREDYTQAYVETPILELRASGVVHGFDILETNYQDLSIFGATDYGVLMRGGVVYVSGVRLDIPTAPVMIPSVAGTYYIGASTTGQFFLLNNSDYTLAQILDGYGGDHALLAKVVHSGVGSNPLTATDLRFFINSLDHKVDLILDSTNRRIGNFASAEAAIDYASNYPHGEKFRIKIASVTQDNITIPSTAPDLVLEIDGSVGSVTVGARCRIVGSQAVERAIPHIRGSLTMSSTCTELHMERVSVSGIATFGNTLVAARLRIKDCRFASSIIISSNDNQLIGCQQLSTAASFTINGPNDSLISGCRFAGPRLTATCDNLVIVDSIFTGSSGFLTTSSNRSSIENCFFDGAAGAGSGALQISGKSTFSNCIFKSVTQSSGNFFAVSSSTALVSIAGSIFQTFLLSSTAAIATLTSGALRIADCDFVGCTFTTNASITCSDFEANRCTSTVTGNLLVKLIGSGRFSKNRGVHAVTTGTLSSDGPVVISENSFPASSIGYNVDISQASTSSLLSQAIVENNHFTSVQNDAILCSSNTQYAIIRNNIFEGGASTNAINLGSTAFELLVQGNVVDTDTFFVSGGNANSLHIKDNLVFTGSTTTLPVTTALTITGNKFESSSALTISGASVTTCTIAENLFAGAFTVNVAMSGGSISNNKFTSTFTVSANLSNLAIESNSFDTFAVSGTPSFTSIKFVNNDCTGSMAGLNTLAWHGCFICVNEFASATNFTLILGNNNVFSNNVFTSAPTVTLIAASAGIINNLILSGNYFNGATLSSSSELEGCNISGNADAAMSFSGNLSDVIISGNNALDSGTGWVFGGALMNVTVTGNNTYTLNMTGTTLSGIVVSGNNLLGDLTVWGQTSATGVSITGNVSNSGAANLLLSSDTTLTNSQVVGNTFGEAEISGLSSISNTVFAQNTITGLAYISTGSTLAATRIESNYVSGTFTVEGNFFNKVHVNNNYVGGAASILVLDAGGVSVRYDAFQLNSNYFSGALTLSPTIRWGTGVQQSKFTNNYAGTWTSSGLSISGSNIFAWGNTGNGTSLVTFAGATPRDITSTNNLSGGITP